MDRAAELATRPPSTHAVASYEQMIQRIRDQLDAELGPFAWRPFREQRRGNCGFDFPIPGGETVRLQSWGFDTHTPDADWPTATRIVTTIATDHGFTTPLHAIDKPTDDDLPLPVHIINGTDPTLGAHYRFATNVNTLISITTGCHPIP